MGSRDRATNSPISRQKGATGRSRGSRKGEVGAAFPLAGKGGGGGHEAGTKFGWALNAEWSS